MGQPLEATEENIEPSDDAGSDLSSKASRSFAPVSGLTVPITAAAVKPLSPLRRPGILVTPIEIDQLMRGQSALRVIAQQALGRATGP